METIWSCLTCSRRPSLRINSQRYSILRLLGDGGYAYVYLVTRPGTEKPLALKKIRCMFGGEGVTNAVREIEAGNVFKYSDRISGCIDSAVVQEEDGTKTVYIVMPYYSAGSLQDRINDNVMNSTEFSEAEVIKYALGTARAIEVLHTHRQTSTNELQPARPRNYNLNASIRRQEEEAQRFLVEDPSEDGVSLGDLLPYAHRDIKPANIMFGSESLSVGTDDSNAGESPAVLIDLGFCSPARVDVSSRSEAVQLQDLAAEHCTLPFRAPELFDVRTGSSINEKVDIWAFGCTLYNMMYSASPFEREEQVSGGNINIAISRGIFSFPEEPTYSSELKELVKACLQVNPCDRPGIGTVIEKLEGMGDAATRT